MGILVRTGMEREWIIWTSRHPVHSCRDGLADPSIVSDGRLGLLSDRILE